VGFETLAERGVTAPTSAAATSSSAPSWPAPGAPYPSPTCGPGYVPGQLPGECLGTLPANCSLSAAYCASLEARTRRHHHRARHRRPAATTHAVVAVARPPLASTGADPGALAGVGLSAALLGAVLVAFGRRAARRSH
jgi:hypothetical protein